MYTRSAPRPTGCRAAASPCTRGASPHKRTGARGDRAQAKRCTRRGCPRACRGTGTRSPMGEGARGAVVSTCMRAHACSGTGTRSHLVENGRSHLAPRLRDNPSQSGPSLRCTHLVEDGREHAAHGLLVRSELLHIGRERLGGEGQAPWWALGMHSHAHAPW
jgi:hypothetical protein